MTVFLGILFSSIRETEVPYVFDWEHESPQHEMHGNRASFEARGKSPEFSRFAAARGVYSRVTVGMAI